MGKSGESDRSAKQARFAAKEERPPKARLVWALVAAAVVLLVVAGVMFLPGRPKATASSSVVAGKAPAAATLGHDPYDQVVAVDGLIHLPLATFDDGLAHYYAYMAGEQPIEFFVLKSQDGTVRAALNACDVCFPAKKGYLQDGDVMVCQNCGSRFPADQINVVQGGCNPAGLDRTISGDALVIEVSDIVAGVKYF